MKVADPEAVRVALERIRDAGADPDPHLEGWTRLLDASPLRLRAQGVDFRRGGARSVRSGVRAHGIAHGNTHALVGVDEGLEGPPLQRRLGGARALPRAPRGAAAGRVGGDHHGRWPAPDRRSAARVGQASNGLQIGTARW